MSKIFYISILAVCSYSVSCECLVFSKIDAHVHNNAAVGMNFDNDFMIPTPPLTFALLHSFPVPCHNKRIYMYKPWYTTGDTLLPTKHTCTNMI